MNEQIFTWLIVALFIGREIQNYRNTEKLMDRLMSKNYGEFKLHERLAKKKKTIPRSHTLTDPEMAIWEGKQDQQIGDINSDIEKRLAEAHKSGNSLGKVGVTNAT